MPDEKPAPLPLTGIEVREAVLFKIDESLSRTCNLRHDDAYSSFKAEISIKLTLSDYGREVKDNHNVTIQGGEILDPFTYGEPRTVATTLTMEPAPPNQVRVETGQDVPVVVTEKGKQVVKHVKYTNRKAKTNVRA